MKKMKAVRIRWAICLLVLCSMMLPGIQTVRAASPGIEITHEQTGSDRTVVLHLFVHMEEPCTAADIRLYYPQEQLELNKCELTNKQDTMLMRYHAGDSVLRIAYAVKPVKPVDPEIKVTFRRLSTDIASYDVSASAWFYAKDPNLGGTEYTDSLTIDAAALSKQTAVAERSVVSAANSKKIVSQRQKVSGRSLASASSRRSGESRPVSSQQGSTASAVSETTEMDLTPRHPFQKGEVQTDHQQIGLFLAMGLIVLAVLVLMIRRREQLRITGGEKKTDDKNSSSDT